MASVEFSINASSSLFFSSSYRIRARKSRGVSRAVPADVRRCSIYGTSPFRFFTILAEIFPYIPSFSLDNRQKFCLFFNKYDYITILTP